MLPAPDMWGLRRPANVLVCCLGRQLHGPPVKSITDTLNQVRGGLAGLSTSDAVARER